MLGAITGDIIGSPYESWANRIKHEEFPLFSPDSRFTDDTVLTLAVADAILNGGDYGAAIQAYARRYPDAGYGHAFRDWIWKEIPQPYNSFGNGSAMRASPIGWAFDTPDAVLSEATRSAAVTHNHPEGIKGAQATALAVFLGRRGVAKADIRAELIARFGYHLDQTVVEIRPGYRFDSSCQGSVPQALIAFFDSASVEDAIRKAVSLGGDSDTQACIAGAVAEAFYGGVPPEIARPALQRMPPDLLAVLGAFRTRYHLPGL